MHQNGFWYWLPSVGVHIHVFLVLMSSFFWIHTQENLFWNEENLRQTESDGNLGSASPVSRSPDQHVCTQTAFGSFYEWRHSSPASLMAPCCATAGGGSGTLIHFISWVIFFPSSNFEEMLCGRSTRAQCSEVVLTFADSHTRWWCHRLESLLDWGKNERAEPTKKMLSAVFQHSAFTFWDGEKSFLKDFLKATCTSLVLFTATPQCP